MSVSWKELNSTTLPNAERTRSALLLPDGVRSFSVLGAHRSGTTWLTNLLGLGLLADRPFEKDAARYLLGISTAHAICHRCIWQGTFLTPCPWLARDLAERTFAVVALRSPTQVIRSMIHNWSGLHDVAALVSQLSSFSPTGDATTDAIGIVRHSMHVLGELFSCGAIDAAVDYEVLLDRPGLSVQAICDGAGVQSVINRPDVRRATESAQMADADAERVDIELTGMYAELLKEAAEKTASPNWLLGEPRQ